MILANLTKAIREQNYYAVVLEFLIVIAGVVIGFQITAWNAARENAGRADQYLQKLVIDLEADREQAARVSQIALDRMAAINSLFSQAGRAEVRYVVPSRSSSILLNSPSAPDFADLNLNVDEITVMPNVPRFAETRNTFDDLINTGNLGLLRNADLTRDLQTYYADAASFDLFEEALWSSFEQVIVSWHRNGISHGSRYRLALIRAIESDDQLAAEIENFWHYSSWQYHVVNDFNSRADDLVASIQAEFSE